MKFAFVFPGQGSQTVGMLAEFASVYPIVQQTLQMSVQKNAVTKTLAEAIISQLISWRWKSGWLN